MNGSGEETSAGGSGTPAAHATARTRRPRRATSGPAPEQPSAAPPSPEQPASSEAVLPDRSADDTDTGWGERPVDDDDERFLRDVPPHW